MMIIVSLSLVFVSVALFTWCLLPDESQRRIRQRIFDEVSSEKRPTFLSRMSELVPPVHRVVPLPGYSRHIAQLLTQAGLRYQPMQFLVLQELGVLTGALIYLIVIGLGSIQVGWALLFIGLGAFVPYSWLRNQVARRRLLIARDFPLVADLLNLCVGAGGDFLGALGRVVTEFRPCPLREELGVVLQEIRVGKRRRDAFKAFADRIQLPEAQSFSRTLTQVDRMGTGLLESLEVLSEDMRLSRYHWADRFAQRAPVKMLIPLVLSLAAALMIVAGPVLGRFLRYGFGGQAMSFSTTTQQAP